MPAIYIPDIYTRTKPGHELALTTKPLKPTWRRHTEQEQEWDREQEQGWEQEWEQERQQS